MTKRLFLDLETCPPPNEAREQLDLALIAKLDSKWRLSNNIAESECPDEQFRRLALYPEVGRIIAIALILEDGDRITHSGVFGRDRRTMLFHGDEKRTISGLWNLISRVGFDERRDLLIGHNIEFDLLWLRKRSIIHSLKPPFNICIPRYRSTFVFDTMREWDLYTWRPGMKLQELAEVLHIGFGKTGEASQVFEWFQEKSEDSHRKLAEYALRDVETTRAVFMKLMFEQ